MSVRKATVAMILRLLLITGMCVPGAAAAEEPLTLKEAVRLSLERNERAQIASLESDAADARVMKARAFFFPDVTLSGTYRRQPPIEASGRPPDALTGTASLNMALFDGRGFPLYRAAAREAEATALSSARTRQLIAFEAADAFLKTLGAQEVREAAARRQQLAKQTLEEAGVRFQAGLVSSNDVTRAQLELATADQALTSAQGNAELARLQLSFLIGAEVTALAPLSDALPAQLRPAEEPKDLVSRALETRTDVAAAQKDVQAAEAVAEEPLWRWVPSLNLTLQYQQTTAAGRFGRPDDWFAALTANWVVFDGLERVADRQERVAQTDIARLREQELTRAVGVDLQRALVALESSEAAVTQAQVAQRVAQKNAEETNTLYRQGLARALEVSDANLRLFEAEVALAQQQYARALAYLDLRAAQGLGPLVEEPSR